MYMKMYRAKVITRTKVVHWKYMIFKVYSSLRSMRFHISDNTWLHNRLAASYSTNPLRFATLFECLVLGVSEMLYSLELPIEEMLSIMDMISRVCDRPIKFNRELVQSLSPANISKLLESNRFESPHFLTSLSLSGLKLPLLPTITKFKIEQLTDVTFIKPTLCDLCKLINESSVNGVPYIIGIHNLRSFLREYHPSIDNWIYRLIKSVPGLYVRLRYKQWCNIYTE